MLLKYGEWRQIAERKISPLDYNDAQNFADDYLAVSYLRKYPYLPSGIDRRQVAIDEFRRTEAACKTTNQRFRKMWDGKLDESFPAVITIVEMAREKLSHILGDLDLRHIAERFGWGPGATTAAKGAWTSAYNKYKLPLDVTSNCAIMGLCCVNSIPAWSSLHAGASQVGEEPRLPVSVLPTQLRVVKGGRMALVPKDATTDRAIIVPVHLNSYIQRGFGKYLRRRLKQVGVDLDDQSYNQRHAQKGSISGDRATIDIKSASNTISKNLVRHLVSSEWFEALLRCREGSIQLPDGKWIELEMFSAMGNGYTFELESAIFYALTASAVEFRRQQLKDNAVEVNQWTGNAFPNTVSVYGDDIIAPSDCFELLNEVYAFCGFEMNTRKSFGSGVFRESCGRDYFKGTLVRPVFLKERIDNARSVTKAANALRRYASSRGLGHGCDARFERVYGDLTARLPKFFRDLKIPVGLGDGGLISNFDEATPPLAGRGWNLFKVRMMADFPVKEDCQQYDAAMLHHLFGEESRNVDDVAPKNRRLWAKIRKGVELSEEEVSYILDVDDSAMPRKGQYDLRGRTRGRVITTHVRTWEDIGPWL